MACKLMRSVVALAGLLLAMSIGVPTAAAAARPAADCQPFSGRPCMFPYPDNRLTRHDGHSATGRRVNLPAVAMPVNTAGQRLAAGPYDVNDGFSPGSAIIIHIPGLTSPRALARTGAVTLTNMSRAFARRQGSRERARQCIRYMQAGAPRAWQASCSTVAGALISGPVEW